MELFDCRLDPVEGANKAPDLVYRYSSVYRVCEVRSFIDWIGQNRHPGGSDMWNGARPKYPLALWKGRKWSQGDHSLRPGEGRRMPIGQSGSRMPNFHRGMTSNLWHRGEL
jgi:hypothetical protein